MGLRPVLQALRSEAGEAMILRDYLFIEQVLPKAVLRTLPVEEMAEYRRPFAEPGEGATANADVAPADPHRG